MADKPLPELGGWTADGFIATFADGSVRFISDKVDDDLLRAFFTKAGGEAVRAIP